MTVTPEKAESYISLEESQRHLVYIMFTFLPKDLKLLLKMVDFRVRAGKT